MRADVALINALIKLKIRASSSKSPRGLFEVCAGNVVGLRADRCQSPRRPHRHLAKNARQSGFSLRYYAFCISRFYPREPYIRSFYGQRTMPQRKKWQIFLARTKKKHYFCSAVVHTSLPAGEVRLKGNGVRIPNSPAAVCSIINGHTCKDWRSMGDETGGRKSSSPINATP